MKLEWKEWWRHLNGEAKLEKAFSFSDDTDWWYFNIDPETQSEPIDDEDEDRVHVDDLFDNEEDAREAAIEWCLEQEDDLIRKMTTLSIWNGGSLSDNED